MMIMLSGGGATSRLYRRAEIAETGTSLVLVLINVGENAIARTADRSAIRT